MIFNDDGSLQTSSAYGYKIPTVPMTPAKFNVKLLEKGMNFPQQVYGSKVLKLHSYPRILQINVLQLKYIRFDR